MNETTNAAASAVHTAAGGIYLGWAPFTIQLGNLMVIVSMIALFVLAIFVPFPRGKAPMPRRSAETTARTPVHAEIPDEEVYTWTGRTRAWLLRVLPPRKLLPQTQPSYVASWIYVFGMGSLAALGYVILSGVVLALNGPAWYHLSPLGLFINSTHLWGVELFFMFMVVHLWGKFWMASWRGGRALTWITGVIAFAVSLVTAFTGYLVQTNFDSQWIAFQAKDALNAVGVGAWFHVADLGQMLMWHIVLLPLAVGVIVVLHVLLVRVHGVVPPLDAGDPAEPAEQAEPAEAAEAAEPAEPVPGSEVPEFPAPATAQHAAQPSRPEIVEVHDEHAHQA